jgi:hypothetical protein
MIGNDQSDVPKIRNFRALALALWYERNSSRRSSRFSKKY